MKHVIKIMMIIIKYSHNYFAVHLLPVRNFSDEPKKKKSRFMSFQLVTHEFSIEEELGINSVI